MKDDNALSDVAPAQAGAHGIWQTSPLRQRRPMPAEPSRGFLLVSSVLWCYRLAFGIDLKSFVEGLVKLGGTTLVVAQDSDQAITLASLHTFGG